MSETRLLLLIPGWFLLLGGLQFTVLLPYSTVTQDAANDTLISQLFLFIVGYALTLIFRFKSTENSSTFSALISILEWSILMAGILTFVHRYTIPFATQSSDYVEMVNRSILIRGFINWLVILLMALFTRGYQMMSVRSSEEKRREDAERMLKDAELSALRQQLQPHFLFNSLNSISALAGSQPEMARQMVQQLSDFLRGTLRKDDRQLIRLSEEIQHLRLYLEIERVRFGHRLNTEIASDAAADECFLPPLLLQPVMENAIKFGLYDTLHDITIRLTAVKEGSMLKMEVTNPFDPTTASPRHGTGFGLSSLQRRLFLIFSRNDLLKTTVEGNTFVTTISIPQPA